MKNKTIALVLVVLTISISLLGGSYLFADNIGDLYYTNHDYKSAHFWYIRDFNCSHSSESLVKLLKVLLLDEYYLQEESSQYYLMLIDRRNDIEPFIFDIALSSQVDYYFSINDINSLKTLVENNYNSLNQSFEKLTLVGTLYQISLSEDISDNDLVWMIGILMKIVKYYESDHLDSAAYFVIGTIYEKLGDIESSEYYLELSYE